jgi:hypothetical protein
MMRRSWKILALASSAALGCPSDDGSGDSTLTAPTSATNASAESGTTEDTSDTSLTTGVSASSTVGDSSEEGSTAAPTSGETTAPAESGSSGDPNACSPVIPGEWNSCHDEMGGVDTTLCNWIGDPDATGFIGCLVRTDMEEYNTCFISGCEDACDCFAPPATGTAVVECAEILAEGGTGCHLNCSNGTCPDGMECLGETCFWPPAG